MDGIPGLSADDEILPMTSTIHSGIEPRIVVQMKAVVGRRGQFPSGDLYVWERAAELPRFERGQHYVAVARRLPYSEREGVGIDAAEPVAFGPVQCSGGLDANMVRDLGRGESPK